MPAAPGGSLARKHSFVSHLKILNRKATKEDEVPLSVDDKEREENLQ